MSAERKYWFGSKGGFGWYPVNFKGWISILIYFAFLIFVFLRISADSHSISNTLISFFPYLFGATVVLLFICYLTGEPISVRKLKI